jgi:chromosome segregation ATPase
VFENKSETSRIEALEHRLAALEPQPEAPKVDLKALKASKTQRQKETAALKSRLGEIKAMAENVDAKIDELNELAHALGVGLVDLITRHGAAIPKDQRRQFAVASSSVHAMIGARLKTLSIKVVIERLEGEFRRERVE